MPELSLALTGWESGHTESAPLTGPASPAAGAASGAGAGAASGMGSAAVPHSPENLPTPFARASSHAASTSGRKRSLPSKTAGSP